MQVICKPVFVANDGTEFLTQSECITYENEWKAVNLVNQIHMWDKDGYPLQFSTDVKTLEIAIDAAQVIDFETDEAADFLLNETDYTSEFFIEPPAAGRYYYDHNECRFLPVARLEELVEKYRRL